MKPTFFQSPGEFHAWLAQHHADTSEVWIGFYKKSSGKEGITYAQALDEALCFGWIDAIRKSIDAARYTIRFTPRKPNSIWSRVNLKRFAELQAEKRVQPSGLAVYTARKPENTNRYSSEQATVALDAAAEKQFKANKPAWTWFQAQAPSYRKAAQWWVISAKKPETRAARLEKLIDESAAQRRLAHLTSPARRKPG